MPAFLMWLVNIFSALVVFFGQYFIVSTAKTAAIVAIYLALIAAYTLAIETVMSSLFGFLMPTGWYKLGMSLMPSNFVVCISAYLASFLIRWLYQQKIQYAKFVSDGYGGVKKAR